MRIHSLFIPDEIIQQYNLRPLIHNDWLYIKIEKGLYGLKQTGYLDHQNLKITWQNMVLDPVDIPQACGNIQFVLVIDDFGIKYTGEQDKTHLLNALRDRYKISFDKSSTNYCGLTLSCNYTSRSLQISMPNYISNLLDHLKLQSSTIEYSPHKHAVPLFGKLVQYETKFVSSTTSK